MLEERYVSFEQAKLLKEKGFPASDNSIYCCYKDNGEFLYNTPLVKIDSALYDLSTGESTVIQRTEYLYAPSLNLVQKWLREEKKIYIDVISETNGKWENGVVYTFSIMMEGLDMVFGEHYDDYDDALSDAIDKSLKILEG